MALALIQHNHERDNCTNRCALSRGAVPGVDFQSAARAKVHWIPILTLAERQIWDTSRFAAAGPKLASWPHAKLILRKISANNGSADTASRRGDSFSPCVNGLRIAPPSI